ncbi:MAG: endonuclease/exonuclease/phosphatase family protein [Planctomycetes bacterium]|nr:endonuclease/exonuclease/phosphatase family protein [Planctomycetota bacterium]
MAFPWLLQCGEFSREEVQRVVTESTETLKRTFKRKLFKRLILLCIVLLLVAYIGSLTLTSDSSGEPRSNREVAHHPQTSLNGDNTEAPRECVLRFMTLNLAHGRSDGPNQIFQKTKKIRSNLDAIAKLLSRVRPDIAALQEADGPSFWSGKFDHVAHLATNAGFEYSARGAHVDGMKISFGTALLSARALKDTLSITFDPTPPTLSKGFLVSTFDWPDAPGMQVDVVSVHLDFSRPSAQRKQVGKMITELSARKRPLIIMGDFNCDWKCDESALRILAQKLELEAYQPEATDLGTFPMRRTRLDWILISPEFQFRKYEVLSDVVSDHFAVVAEIGLGDEYPIRSPR